MMMSVQEKIQFVQHIQFVETRLDRITYVICYLGFYKDSSSIYLSVIVRRVIECQIKDTFAKVNLFLISTVVRSFYYIRH